MKMKIALFVLFIQQMIFYYPNAVDTAMLLGQTPGKSFAFAQVKDGSTVASEIDLNGPWQFKATDGEEWMDAVIPSTDWTDLIRVGRLEDPFYRDNELKVQWVEKKAWEYRRTFHVDESFLRHDQIVLDCRGLDTISEIYVNDSPVAETQNMFIEYEFDVKHLLHAGENRIHIIFRSIIEWDKEQVASEPGVTWINSKGRTFFSRKEGSDFGWDWGIRLVTYGIWRSIRLAAYDKGRITELAVQQNLTDPDRAVLDVMTDVEGFGDEKFNLGIQILYNGRVVDMAKIPVIDNRVSKKLNIRNPRLWWPNGWGEQALYTVRATLKDGDQTVHMKEIRIGLRTIELVREKDDRGENFGFRVNGHPIFCKGANWVPADALPDRLTKGHYTHLLRSCKEVNMNMIRLWGGGLYEPDIFYDLCDEYGIMIWHDFMFAVGPFIANESYLENVRQEIANVVQRLRHHPSIVLWCGNNECESNMKNWVENNKTLTWKDYDKIFNEVIPRTAARYDPDRTYWPSSPHHPLDHHNKCGKKPDESASNVRIVKYLSEMIKMPNGFENWVYVSQVMHGEGMKIGTEAYRRNYPHTTGALYWQLNDNWPTISGSSMDYYGRWKALHYMARHFFNPILVSGRVEGTTVEIWGVNDSLRDISVKLRWTLAQFDGNEVKRGDSDLVLPANSSTLIDALDFKNQVSENPGHSTYRKDSFENRRRFYLVYALYQGNRKLTSNVSFFVPQKYLPLKDPVLKYLKRF